MSSQGPQSPGTMADDATVGTIAWSSVDEAKVSDGSYVICVLGGNPGDIQSHYLKASNFGFTIPAGNNIDGILVEIEKGGGGGTEVFDKAVRIVKSTGAIGTTDKSSGTVWLAFGNSVYIPYGGSSDLWGETWTAADINNANFGFVISGYLPVEVGGVLLGVDHIRVTVYYSAGAPPPVATTSPKRYLSFLSKIAPLNMFRFSPEDTTFPKHLIVPLFTRMNKNKKKQSNRTKF